MAGPARRRPIPGPAARRLLTEIGGRVDDVRRLERGAGEVLLRSIVDATVTLFQAHAASIALFDPPNGRLVFRVAAGEQGQGVVGVSILPDQGLAGYVFSTGQALALSDVASDPRFGRSVAESTAYVPRSIVAVPLVDEDRTIGVLEVLDKRDSSAFSLRDVELAGVFARQAAIAISASRVERDTAGPTGRSGPAGPVAWAATPRSTTSSRWRPRRSGRMTRAASGASLSCSRGSVGQIRPRSTCSWT